LDQYIIKHGIFYLVIDSFSRINKKGQKSRLDHLDQMPGPEAALIDFGRPVTPGFRQLGAGIPSPLMKIDE